VQQFHALARWFQISDEKFSSPGRYTERPAGEKLGRCVGRQRGDSAAGEGGGGAGPGQITVKTAAGDGWALANEGGKGLGAAAFAQTKSLSVRKVSCAQQMPGRRIV